MPPVETNRRAKIVEAAKRCFLKFGFAKTSFSDIAKEANISRPLIYLQFKSKDELMSAAFESLFVERYPRVEKILAAGGTAREKLWAIYAILMIEPWSEVMKGTNAQEFYEACERIIPEAEATYQKHRLRYTQAVLGDRDLAVVFSLAADGMSADLPTMAVLRKRMRRLVDRFTA